MLYIIIWSSLFLVLLILYAVVFLFNKKLNSLEFKILGSFSRRTNILPWLFEITRDIIVKHDQVFAQSLSLRKEEFAKMAISDPLYKFMDLEVDLHKEINFIYKVCSKHPKMMKNVKFIYLRGLLIDRSSEIWTELERYKKFVKTFNKLVLIKNITILGLLIPISKKLEL